jgi:hypothetical protein
MWGLEMNHKVLLLSFAVGIALMGLSVFGLAGLPFLAVSDEIFLLMSLVGFLILLFIFVKYE